MPGTAALLQAVEKDKNGIVTVAQVRPRAKALKIKKSAESAAVEPRRKMSLVANTQFGGTYTTI